MKSIKVIDLFCGIGGLSHWLTKAGLKVTAGFDIDGTCKFGYEHNNNAKFYQQDIKTLESKKLKDIFWNANIKILVGCAPCQPYSLMNTKKWIYSWDDIKERSPVDKFASLIREIKPEIISMENVPGLMTNKKSDSFQNFLNTLNECDYKYDYKVVNCTDYGIPQTRKRLILVASRIGEIKIIAPTHKVPVTLKEIIKDLPKLKSWETSKTDKYHTCQNLTKVNLERLKYIPHDGWDLSMIDSKYRPECFKKKSGKSYLKNVYGRMFRDKPAPTMTTLCTGLWNGRFWHPEQDRAISVREAARIQTFPDDYHFFPKWEPCNIQKASKFIGNAVPVKLGEVIGKSILKSLSSLR